MEDKTQAQYWAALEAADDARELHEQLMLDQKGQVTPESEALRLAWIEAERLLDIARVAAGL